MKNKNNLELRMYGLVCYSLSPIQQGIQFGHAVVEYGLLNFDTPDYQKWANNDKVFIVLNGGTTNWKNHSGSLNQHLKTLEDNKIIVGEFSEPDLGDQLTAVVFIVDERSFNREKYYDKENRCWYPCDDPEVNFLREFLQQFRLA